MKARSKVVRRVATATLLGSLCSAVQAIGTPDEYLCGIGTIEEVIEGAWQWEGIHYTVKWEEGSPVGLLPERRADTVRVLAEGLEPDQVKVLRAVGWLAFTNGYRVKFATFEQTPSGLADCGRIEEMHLMRSTDDGS